jgi:hypothetical protein
VTHAEPKENTMRSLRPALLLIMGLGLAGCVGVNDGYYRQPYGSTFSGNSGFVTPYRYPSPSTGYLYDQSHRSWQGNTYRWGQTYRQGQGYAPNRNYGQGQSNNPNRGNPPGHNNPPGRRNRPNSD